MAVCRRCFISGRVQGVTYSAATQRKAQELQLSGYARNLSDGRVEVLICGKEAAIDALAAWLWQGPPHAQVSDVTCMNVELDPPADFSVEYLYLTSGSPRTNCISHSPLARSNTVAKLGAIPGRAHAAPWRRQSCASADMTSSQALKVLNSARASRGLKVLQRVHHEWPRVFLRSMPCRVLVSGKSSGRY